MARLRTMHLFSEEYLMHYGVKGMKWRHHKKSQTRINDVGDDRELIPGNQFHETGATPEPDFDTTINLYPEAHLDTGFGLVNGEYMSDTAAQALYWNDQRLEGKRKKIREYWTNYRRAQEQTPEGRKRVEAIRAVSDELRRRDLDYLRKNREKSYHKRRKKLERQQQRAKVINTVKRAGQSTTRRAKKVKDAVKNAIRRRKKR